MLRIIREQEPLTPSTRISQMQTQNGTAVMRKSPVPASTLKGELDWIVMKAMQKDRNHQASAGLRVMVTSFMGCRLRLTCQV
jgi:predicted LPLAT superfamily acyltransferase